MPEIAIAMGFLLIFVKNSLKLLKFAEYSLNSLDKSECSVYNKDNHIMWRNQYEIRN